jgi:hypothetical protein
MAGNKIRHRDRGDVTTRGGPVVDRAIARVGWWLPEAVAAAAVAGLAVWAGLGWLLWPIGLGLAVRIGWEWSPARRSARFLAAMVAAVAGWVRRVRQRRAARTSTPAPESRGAGAERDEVAS